MELRSWARGSRHSAGRLAILGLCMAPAYPVSFLVVTTIPGRDIPSTAGYLVLFLSLLVISSLGWWVLLGALLMVTLDRWRTRRIRLHLDVERPRATLALDVALLLPQGFRICPRTEDGRRLIALLRLQGADEFLTHHAWPPDGSAGSPR